MLVTCTDTHHAFLASSCDLWLCRSDLDGALVETKLSVIGLVHDLLVANQPWSSALVARALTDVDMARVGAMAVAHLLAHGRCPGTFNSYEGNFDGFFQFWTNMQASQGFPALSPMPSTSSSFASLPWLAAGGGQGPC